MLLWMFCCFVFAANDRAVDGGGRGGGGGQSTHAANNTGGLTSNDEVFKQVINQVAEQFNK